MHNTTCSGHVQFDCEETRIAAAPAKEVSGSEKEKKRLSIRSLAQLWDAQNHYDLQIFDCHLTRYFRSKTQLSAILDTVTQGIG